MQLDVLQCWCWARGQTVADYLMHLETGGKADGLEVLLVSIVMDMNINIVQEDSVWATSCDGINFEQLTIVSALVGALSCRYVNPDAGNTADVDTRKTSESPEEHDEIPSALHQ